jgi:hypothetical protein
MDEGFPAGRLSVLAKQWYGVALRSPPEPVACVMRRGPTPPHPEPGRETRQRRWYWRDARWESRSVRRNNAAWSSGSSSGS